MTSLRDGLMLTGGGVVSLVGAGGKTSLMFTLARELSLAGETVLTTTTTKIYRPSRDQSEVVVLSDSATDLQDRVRGLLSKHRHITAAFSNIAEPGKLRGFDPEVVDQLYQTGLFQWIIVEADGAAGRPLKAPAAHEPVIPGCTTRLVGVIGLDGAGQPVNAQWIFRPERFTRLAGLAPGAAVTADAIADVLVHPNGIFKGAPQAVMRIAFCNQADVPKNLAAGHRIARELSERKDTGLKRVAIGQALFTPPVLAVYDLEPFIP